MLRRFAGLFHKDSMTALRNYYFHIVMLVALLFVIVVRLVIPAEATVKPAVYYYMGYRGDMEESFRDIIGVSEDEHAKVFQVSSEKEIVEKMKKDFNSLGMVIKEREGRPLVKFIVQGHENERVRNMLVLAVKDAINKAVYKDMDIDTVYLKKDILVREIPTNENVLPMFILTEPVLLGFILIAVLVFMEKEEGTIRAYMVSPGRIPEYLASKITLMLILGLLSAGIVTSLVMGLKADYLSLFILVALGSIFGSSLGLILASFFDNISQSMIWIIVVSIPLTLPFVSYFIPSFAPLYIKLLPTYSLLFAIREAVFPSGNTGIVYSAAFTTAVAGLVSYILAVLAYRRNLARS